MIYERPDQKEWGFGAIVTEDGRYLVIAVSKGTHREKGVLFRDLEDESGSVEELLVEFDAGYTFVGNDGSVFYFLTDFDAPMGRLIAVDLTRPARSDWKEIPVSEIMTRKVLYIPNHVSLAEVAETMLQADIHQLVVVGPPEGGSVAIGIITLQDVLNNAI